MANFGRPLYDDKSVKDYMNSIDNNFQNYNINNIFGEHSERCKNTNNSGILNGSTTDVHVKQSHLITDIESDLKLLNAKLDRYEHGTNEMPNNSVNQIPCCDKTIDTIHSKLDNNISMYKELSTWNHVYYEPNCPVTCSRFNNVLGINTSLEAKDSHIEKKPCLLPDKAKIHTNNIHYSYMDCSQNCQDKSQPCSPDNNSDISGTNVYNTLFTTS
jgi:hypothetical protein